MILIVHERIDYEAPIDRIHVGRADLADLLPLHVQRYLGIIAVILAKVITVHILHVGDVRGQLGVLRVLVAVIVKPKMHCRRVVTNVAVCVQNIKVLVCGANAGSGWGEGRQEQPVIFHF